MSSLSSTDMQVMVLSNTELNSAMSPAMSPLNGGDDESSSSALVASLRKELKAAINDKAQMEMDFMNMLSSLEGDKKSSVQMLETKVREKDDINTTLKNANEIAAEQINDLQVAVDELRELLTSERMSHQREKNRLESKIEEIVTSTLGKAEEENEALASEVEELREQLDDESRRALHLKLEVDALQSERNLAEKNSMHDMEKRAAVHQVELDRLREAVGTKDATLEEKDRIIYQMNDKMKEVEDRNSMLESAADRMREQLQTETNQVLELTNALESMKQDFTAVKANAANNSGDAFRLEVSRLQISLSEKHTLLQAKEAELDQANSSLNEAQDSVEVLSKTVDELRKVVDSESTRSQDLMKELNDVRNVNKSEKDVMGEMEKATATHRAHIRRLEASLSERDSRLITKSNELEIIKGTLRESEEHVETLGGQVEDLRQKLDDECQVAEELRQLANTLDSDLRQKERSVADEMEKKLAQRSADRDMEMDSLHKELTKANMEKADMEMELMRVMNNITQLETSKTSMKTDFEDVLQYEKSKVQELSHELNGKDDQIALVAKERDQLRREMDQLCDSMKDLASSRRNEIEELQEELMKTTSDLTHQEREVQSLKMALDSERLTHNDDLSKLKSKLREAQQPSSASRAVAAADFLQNENKMDALKKDNGRLKKEILSLREKMNGLMEKEDSSQATKVLRSRNSALKKEVEKLTKRCKQLERSITRVEF